MYSSILSNPYKIFMSKVYDILMMSMHNLIILQSWTNMLLHNIRISWYQPGEVDHLAMPKKQCRLLPLSEHK